MTDQRDPRLAAYLAAAMERPHPFYAAQLLKFAARAGDEDAVDAALALGALSWRPEPAIRMRTEEEPEIIRGEIIQLRFWGEAA